MPLTPEQIETLRRPVQHAADEMLRKGPEWLYDRCIAAGMADARFAALMQEFAGVRKAERLAELREVRKAAVEAGVTKAEWEAIPKAEWEAIPEEVTP